MPIAVVEEASLPPGWDAELPIKETQEIGDRWVQGGVSAVLEVPSSIVPGGANVLLNPAHAAFAAIEFRRAVPFRFDPRLK